MVGLLMVRSCRAGSSRPRGRHGGIRRRGSACQHRHREEARQRIGVPRARLSRAGRTRPPRGVRASTSRRATWSNETISRPAARARVRTAAKALRQAQAVPSRTTRPRLPARQRAARRASSSSRSSCRSTIQARSTGSQSGAGLPGRRLRTPSQPRRSSATTKGRVWCPMTATCAVCGRWAIAITRSTSAPSASSDTGLDGGSPSAYGGRCSGSWPIPPTH